MANSSVVTRQIDAEEATHLMAACRRYVAQNPGPNAAALPDVQELRSEVPEGVRAALTMPKGAAALLLRGFPVRDEEVVRTPSSWRDVVQLPAFGVLLAVVAGAVGEPFAWQGQQDGRLVNSIIPAQGHEHLQTGASSTTLLSPHTEDAFHRERAHLIMLGGVRNHEQVGTTCASIRDVLATGCLSDSDVAHLRQPECPILPDDSYTPTDSDGKQLPVATLWEREDGTCLRYDPAYTPTERARPAWRSAYERLGEGLAAVTQRIALDPGDILILDNDMAVHGRVPFQPRFDGTDRWLVRLNVAVPGRDRPATESFEDGFGQLTVRPFGALV